MSPSFTLHDGLGHPVRLPEDGQAFDDEDVGGRDCEGSDASSDVPDQFPVGYTIDFAGSASGSPHAEVTEDGAPRGGSGSQVLPVAEGLAAAHSGVPTDGAEYLYLVRQEARSRPKVVARGNPFATLTSTTRPRSDDHGTRASPWSDAFEARFRNVRANLAAVTSSTRGRPHLAVPAPRDESNWRLYIDGRAGASGNQQGHDADLHLVASLDQVTVTALLGHFANWLEIALERFVQTGQGTLPDVHNASSILLPRHATWIFALLAALSDVLTAEDVHTIRRLAKACRQATIVLESEEADDAAVASSRCLVQAAGRIWGQFDLLE